mmetsp:Transcript_34740/g.73996  ORF Transcript_34740/g.73996 Transcript_34740/m.73996 type:complete len:173 (+) Transcript_34740:503-1021(+)
MPLGGHIGVRRTVSDPVACVHIARLPLPEPPTMNKLGTTSGLGAQMRKENEEKYQYLKESAHEERDNREDRGEGDRWSEKQVNTALEIDDNFVGFKIEMCFTYFGDDGSECLGWYHGKVTDVLNAKTGRVRVEWNKDCLGKNDKGVTTQTLRPAKWNPKKAIGGGWREYLTK